MHLLQQLLCLHLSGEQGPTKHLSLHHGSDEHQRDDEVQHQSLNHSLQQRHLSAR